MPRNHHQRAATRGEVTIRRSATRQRRSKKDLVLWTGLCALVVGGATIPAHGGDEGGTAPPGGEPKAQPGAEARGLDATLKRLEGRVDVLEERAEAFDVFLVEEIEPMVRTLTRMRDDRAQAQRIALALLREGHRASVSPRLLLAVMAVENPWLEPAASSPVGALGLMQVMPFHAGGWGCVGDDLTDPDTNICHGARILADALERSDGDLDRALLRYNGCVRGTNTPDCHLYPSKVLGHRGLRAFGM